MTHYMRVSDAKGRDAVVGFRGVKGPPAPKLGLPGVELEFKRYLVATERCTDAALKLSLGADYAKALVEGDPEVDLERAGQVLEHTMGVYLDGAGALLQSDPGVVEVVLAPDGSERERRAPAETESNINTELPVRWSGRKVPVKDAVRRFAFRRTVQLQHVDGLTYDFLYGMALELEKAGVVMLLGSGDKGTGPLVFQANGRAYRGFLSGQTEGAKYRLLLHLSDMELKRPAPAGEAKP
jgi:hypothetical protein